MKRQFVALSLIAVGVLVAVASAIYWHFASAVNNPGKTSVPDRIAGPSLSQVSCGPDAVAEVTQLHNKSFPLSSGAAAMYGGPGMMATLWVAGTPVRPVASKMVSDIEAAIETGRSPFTHLDVRSVDGRAVYELTGMGQQHFYFQSGS